MLNYCLADGTSVLRYDNQEGKGDHRRIEEQEQSYNFASLSQLYADFFADIENLRRQLG